VEDGKTAADVLGMTVHPIGSHWKFAYSLLCNIVLYNITVLL